MTSSADTLDEAYEMIRARFEHYGKTGMSQRLTTRRRVELKKLLEDFSADQLVSAVDGYLHFHGGLDGMIVDKPVRKYFRWKTIFGPESVEDRIEEGPEKGIWRPRKSKTGSQYRDASEVMADARRKQAEDDARRERKANPLSVVGEG